MHQRVVAERALGRHLAALVVDERRDTHLAPLAVEPGHLADAVAEAVPVRLRQVVDLVHAQVHAAGGDLVQLRLPDVRARLVDQRDVGPAALAERVAEPRRQLEHDISASY